MPTTIKLRNSVTTTSAPSSLVQGEVAINITDKKVWVGNAATTPIQLLGDGGSGSFTSIAFGAGTVSSPSITFTGDTNTGIYSPAADTIAFTEGGVESMRINSAGNVGIGTSSPATKLDVNGTIRISGNSQLQIFNSGGTSGVSIQTDNASSTAMTFATGGTERMRIDSSGNVGIGTSSPTNYGAGTTTLSISNSSGSGYFDLYNAGSRRGYHYATASTYNISTTTSTALVFETVGSERMRIDSSGNVGIGMTPIGDTALEIYNANSATVYKNVNSGTDGSSGFYVGMGKGSLTEAYVYNRENNNIIFGTNNTERMRITSGGALLVGTTTNTDNYLTNIQFSGSATNGLIVKNTASTGAPTLLFLHDSAQTLNNATDSAYYTDSTATRWTLRKNGGLANYQANNVNLSDEREKTNIELAGSYLDKICAIPVKTFNYIDQNREEDDGLTLGVIAQDVQAVAPELVMESDWSVKRDGSKMRLSIYQTDLQYALMKCIQEQQTMIEELKQEVAKLKGV